MRDEVTEQRRAMFAGSVIGMLALDAAFAVVVFVIVTKHPIPQGPSYRVPAHRPDLSALAAVYFGLILATGIWWISWQRQAHRTLVQRGVWLRHGPNSVWWWLMPLVNLFAGPSAVRDIGRNVPAARWLSVGMRDRLVRVWWLLFAFLWLSTGQGTWEVRLGSWGLEAPLARSSIVIWGITAILAATVVVSIEAGIDNVLPWTDPTVAAVAPSLPRRIGRRLAKHA